MAVEETRPAADAHMGNAARSDYGSRIHCGEWRGRVATDIDGRHATNRSAIMPAILNAWSTEMRRLHALRFELDPRGVTAVVVWPDSPAGRYRPVDRKMHWLDVQAGDQVFVTGKRHTLSAVRSFRADGLDATRPIVTCGREWIRVQTSVDDSCCD